MLPSPPAVDLALAYTAEEGWHFIAKPPPWWLRAMDAADDEGRSARREQDARRLAAARSRHEEWRRLQEAG